MTTAHRPTWKAAVGRASEGGFAAPSSAQSILDVAAHTKLKVRRGHQLIEDNNDNKKAELLRASIVKLQQAEARLKLSKTSGNGNFVDIEKREIIPAIEAEGQRRLLKQTADVDDVKVKEKYNDDDKDHGEDDDDSSNGLFDDVDDSDLDVSDSDLDGVGRDVDSDDDDNDSDDEDEEAALQAELSKIRAERAAAKAKQEAEAAKREESRMEEAALIGNPLLISEGKGQTTTSGKLKRRWNDDVVFRNQAKGEPDRNKKRFINDTVRNDFHKRFLNKFIL